MISNTKLTFNLFFYFWMLELWLQSACALIGHSSGVSCHDKSSWMRHQHQHRKLPSLLPNVHVSDVPVPGQARPDCNACIAFKAVNTAWARAVIWLCDKTVRAAGVFRGFSEKTAIIFFTRYSFFKLAARTCGSTSPTQQLSARACRLLPSLNGDFVSQLVHWLSIHFARQNTGTKAPDQLNVKMVL